MDHATLAGAWANEFRVICGPDLHEWTLDFIRMDASQQPPVGVVVARVSCSPILAAQIAKLMDQSVSSYTESIRKKELGDGAG